MGSLAFYSEWNNTQKSGFAGHLAENMRYVTEPPMFSILKTKEGMWLAFLLATRRLQFIAYVNFLTPEVLTTTSRLSNIFPIHLYSKGAISMKLNLP